MGKKASEQMRRTGLQRLEESVLNAAEFCRRQGLCYATVLRWRREAGNGRRQPSFVEVEVADTEQTDDVAGKELGCPLCVRSLRFQVAPCCASMERIKLRPHNDLYPGIESLSRTAAG